MSDIAGDPMVCADVEALAPELALGTLTGNERAGALIHLEDCAHCRQLVDDLAAVADGLLLLAPEAEPPIGFEGRTAERIAAVAAGASGGRRPRRWSRVLLVAAAAFLVGALGAGSAAWWAGGKHAHHAVAGPLVRTAAVAASSGYTCHAIAIGSSPSWLYLSIEQPNRHDGTYRVEAVRSGGNPVSLGDIDVHDGRGAIGAAVGIPVQTLQSLRVYDAKGVLRYEAKFTTAAAPGPSTTTTTDAATKVI